MKLLTVDWLGDFPFAGTADKANTIAVLLAMTGRMFFAPAPLFVFDASTAGSGKGLLATTISLIATGSPPHLPHLLALGLLPLGFPAQESLAGQLGPVEHLLLDGPRLVQLAGLLAATGRGATSPDGPVPGIWLFASRPCQQGVSGER